MDDHSPRDAAETPAPGPAATPAKRVYETPPTSRPITDAEAARAEKLAANEHIKIASGYLRGTLADRAPETRHRGRSRRMTGSS